MALVGDRDVGREVVALVGEVMCTGLSHLESGSAGRAVGIHSVHIHWPGASDDKPITHWVTDNLHEHNTSHDNVNTPLESTLKHLFLPQFVLL